MDSFMTLHEQAEVTLLILLAAFLSGMIGMDRERKEKDAGVRTHMLVGVGACLFTALSRLAFGGAADTPLGIGGADASRVASNIVTGVGFLGAGVIWRSKHRVHDLTTAASIWLTAAVGMSVGAGAWLLALSSTVIVWIILAVLQYLPFRSSNIRRAQKRKQSRGEVHPPELIHNQS